MTLALRRPQTVIEAGDGAGAYWKDLWNYRSLLRFLVRRDLTVHYRQTVIGVAWALLRPLLTIAVFSVFGAVFQTGTEGLPRVLLVAPAALLWQLFSSSVTDASNSLIANANLITKVYFPRSIVPLSSVVVCLVDFLVALSILAVLMFWYGYVPGATVLLVPIFVLLALMSALGAGLLLSALNVKYRDFRYIVPFMVQLGLYVSPVAFSSSAIRASTRVPPILKALYFLNPMVAPIEGLRWSLLGARFPIPAPAVALSAGVGLALLLGGNAYFRRAESSFADVI